MKHVSDDMGLCWCEACTKRLLALHEAHLKEWKRQQEPLGEPFQSILDKNLWDLYAR